MLVNLRKTFQKIFGKRADEAIHWKFDLYDGVTVYDDRPSTIQKTMYMLGKIDRLFGGKVIGIVIHPNISSIKLAEEVEFAPKHFTKDIFFYQGERFGGKLCMSAPSHPKIILFEESIIDHGTLQVICDLLMHAPPGRYTKK